MLKLWENPLLSIDDRLEVAIGEIERLHGLLENAAERYRTPVEKEQNDAIAVAYGYLWHVNNEPGTPNQYPSERAAYEARKVLRDLMTHEERGNAINRVRELMTPNDQGKGLTR